MFTDRIFGACFTWGPCRKMLFGPEAGVAIAATGLSFTWLKLSKHYGSSLFEKGLDWAFPKSLDNKSKAEFIQATCSTACVFGLASLHSPLAVASAAVGSFGGCWSVRGDKNSGLIRTQHFPSSLEAGFATGLSVYVLSSLILGQDLALTVAPLQSLAVMVSAFAINNIVEKSYSYFKG